MGSGMQQRSKGRKGWIVFTLVSVVALGSTIASAGLGRRSHGRFDEARASIDAQCKGKPCALTSSPPSVFPEYRLGVQDLKSGQLVRALERADHIDRTKTLVSSLVAAKLFDGVVDRVDAHPELLDDPRLVAALRKASFASAYRPLESERLHALAVLATVPSQVPMSTLGFAESTTTQAMNDVDVALHEMEDSALAGDIKGCERASQKPKGLAAQVTVGPSICKSAQRIVDTRRRLSRLQLRAATHLPRSTTRTARLPTTL